MEILGDGFFQLTVDVLGSADETNGRHSVAALVHSLFGGCYQAGIVRKAEVVVGAEIQCLATVFQSDFSPLRGADITFAFVEPGLFDGLELILQILLKFAVHNYDY